RYKVTVRAEFPVGACSARGGALFGGAVIVNGQAARPSTAVDILKSIMSRDSTGVSIGTTSIGAGRPGGFWPFNVLFGRTGAGVTTADAPSKPDASHAGAAPEQSGP
ncbi:MAG: hypothetical protein ACE5E6_07900, partial [Phycisphaerae bacterium]